MLKISLISARMLLLNNTQKNNWYTKTFTLIILAIIRTIISYNYINVPIFFSQNVFIDHLRRPLIILTLWISALILLSRQQILITMNKHTYFTFLIILLNSILIITFSTNNILSFYIIFEASLIPTLLLILGWGYQPERLQAGIYLILYTITASLPLLISLLWINSCNKHSSIYILLWNSPTQSLQLISIWWLITIIAFIVKIPLFLTHLWLPKAHVEAPVAGSIILAAILLKLGRYGVLRAAMALTWTNHSLTPIISSIAIWGACITGVICTRQTDIKSLIAYSSVGHIGLLIGGTISNSRWGWSSSLTIMLAHGLCSSAIFSLANITYETTQTRRMFITKGLLNLFPLITLLWFIISAANMAAPPSINLLGEIILMTRSLKISTWFILPIGITAFIAAAYSLILYTSSQHGWPPRFLKPLNSLNPRNYSIIVAHAIPIIFLISSPEIITLWLWPCSWITTLNCNFKSVLFTKASIYI